MTQLQCEFICVRPWLDDYVESYDVDYSLFLFLSILVSVGLRLGESDA